MMLGVDTDSLLKYINGSQTMHASVQWGMKE